MTPVIKVSYIVAFYNNVHALLLILEALKRQSFKEFELIIADDGSTGEVVEKVSKLKKSYPFPIQHLWHEDSGWQKNIILNKAILASQSDYLLFTDGDCIPHPKFIEQHYINRKVGKALTGRRQNLSEYVTAKLSVNKIKRGYLQHLGFFTGLILSIFGKGNHFECGFYIKSNALRRFDNRKQRGILGCNFSIHRDDILKINGFDERYLNPGVGEDSDPDFRLRLLGMEVESIKYLAVQYHLYHKELPRKGNNWQIFEEVKKDGNAWTEFGIQKTNNSDFAEK